MMLGIAAVKPGATLGDVGHAIQSFVEPHRFSVVRDFCGPSLGRTFHAPPRVLHYGRPGEGTVLRTGMFFTVEPLTKAGRSEVKDLDQVRNSDVRGHDVQGSEDLGYTRDIKK